MMTFIVNSEVAVALQSKPGGAESLTVGALEVSCGDHC